MFAGRKYPVTFRQLLLYTLKLSVNSCRFSVVRERRMSVASHSAARFICARGNWSVTNLSLQKILYLAHMVHLGRTGQRLVNNDFEAWDYGPVEPDLYRAVRMFGSKPIQDIFYFSSPIAQGIEEATLVETCDALIPKKPGELVAITHWQNGAWAKNYVAGSRGIVIPDQDIIAEYNARTS